MTFQEPKAHVNRILVALVEIRSEILLHLPTNSKAILTDVFSSLLCSILELYDGAYNRIEGGMSMNGGLQAVIDVESVMSIAHFYMDDNDQELQESKQQVLGTIYESMPSPKSSEKWVMSELDEVKSILKQWKSSNEIVLMALKN